MLEIAIMIEGQNGLTWPRWQKIVRFVEELGFVGLYRSDHFTNSNPPDLESLELWTSLTWLACNTKRIEFGPLVTPFSFRHPAFTARMASSVDDLSGGRLTLGLGAGWRDREHHLFGFDLLEPKSRFDRFEEGMEVLTRLLQVGGNGGKRTMSNVVLYTTEWNCVMLTPQEFTRLNESLTQMLNDAGKNPESVRRSMMTNCVFGKDETALKEKLSARGRTLEQLRQRGIVAGSGDAVVEQLQELEQVGLRRIMLQWLDLDDLNGLEALAEVVL